MHACLSPIGILSLFLLVGCNSSNQAQLRPDYYHYKNGSPTSQDPDAMNPIKNIGNTCYMASALLLLTQDTIWKAYGLDQWPSKTDREIQLALLANDIQSRAARFPSIPQETLLVDEEGQVLVSQDQLEQFLGNLPPAEKQLLQQDVILARTAYRCLVDIKQAVEAPTPIKQQIPKALLKNLLTALKPFTSYYRYNIHSVEDFTRQQDPLDFIRLVIQTLNPFQPDNASQQSILPSLLVQPSQSRIAFNSRENVAHGRQASLGQKIEDYPIVQTFILTPENPNIALNAALVPTCTLQQCLDYKFRTEEPENVANAQLQVQANRLTNLPEVFVFSLARRGVCTQLAGNVDKIQLHKEWIYENLDQDHYNYQLSACIIHSNPQSDGGHYTIYQKRNNKWFYHDDLSATASQKRWEAILPTLLQKGYVFVYERIHEEAEN